MRNRSMALAVRNDTILMVKQKVIEKEFYIIPGGGIEEGETPEQAALRELKEECGFHGTIIKHLTTNHRKNGDTEYIYWVNVAEGQEGVIGSDPEYDVHNQIIVDVKWMKLNELSEKDRAFLWSYGLMDVYGFEEEVMSWGDTVSYPV